MGSYARAFRDLVACRRAAYKTGIERTVISSPLAVAPIEAIWWRAAASLGFRVSRTEKVYASSDGRGVIEIGVDDLLDGDDSVAQLVFHELCHALVEGPAAWRLPDWGLSNTDDRDIVREHACLRVQVSLTEPHALRELMAPTTEYRAYHDAIAGDPLGPADDPAAAIAKAAIARDETRPWLEVLASALAHTRAFLDGVGEQPAAAEGTEPVWLHPVGFPFGAGVARCESCAWYYRGGRGRAVERCRQSAGRDGQGRRTSARYRACVRWEPVVDCQSCGACCREAYHSVTVAVRDPVVWKQPALISRNGHRFEVRREGERCAALLVDRHGAPAFSCAIYEDRPRPCRDFEAGGAHCLVARRRVGLSL